MIKKEQNMKYFTLFSDGMAGGFTGTKLKREKYTNDDVTTRISNYDYVTTMKNYTGKVIGI